MQTETQMPKKFIISSIVLIVLTALIYFLTGNDALISYDPIAVIFFLMYFSFLPLAIFWLNQFLGVFKKVIRKDEAFTNLLPFQRNIVVSFLVVGCFILMFLLYLLLVTIVGSIFYYQWIKYGDN